MLVVMSDPELLADLEARLGDVRRVRSETRRSLMTSGWGILTLWGVVFLISVPMNGLLGDRVGYFWLVAVPLAVVASFVLGHRAEMRIGDGGPLWPHVVVSGWLVVGSFATSFLLEGRAMVVSWWLVLTLGFGVMALIDGHRLVAAGLALLLVWGVAVALAPTGERIQVAYPLLATGLGAYLSGVGLALRTMRS